MTIAYVPGQRMTKKVSDQLRFERGCVNCDGMLLRLAERELTTPYRWQAIGYICNKCRWIFRMEA